MSTVSIKQWVEVAALHPDVLADDFSEDIFALHLGPLTDGNPNVPAVYRDPEHFFLRIVSDKGLAQSAAGRALTAGGRCREPGSQIDHAVWWRQIAHVGVAVSRRPTTHGAGRDPRRQGAP